MGALHHAVRGKECWPRVPPELDGALRAPAQGHHRAWHETGIAASRCSDTKLRTSLPGHPLSLLALSGSASSV